MNNYRTILQVRDKSYNNINDLASVRVLNKDKQIRLAIERKKLKSKYKFCTNLLKELDKVVNK